MYDKAIEMDPDNIETHFNRAWIARNHVFKMDSRITSSDCEKHVKEVLKRDPNHSEGNLLMGVNFLMSGKGN